MLSPSSDVQSDLVLRASRTLLDLGAPYQLVGYGRAEVLANVLMVVPAGTLAMLAFPRTRWHQWAAYGFLGALAVEVAQALALPERDASSTDVVANALGLLLGALLVSVVRRLTRRGGSR